MTVSHWQNQKWSTLREKRSFILQFVIIWMIHLNAHSSVVWAYSFWRFVSTKTAVTICSLVKLHQKLLSSTSINRMCSDARTKRWRTSNLIIFLLKLLWMEADWWPNDSIHVGVEYNDDDSTMFQFERKKSLLAKCGKNKHANKLNESKQWNNNNNNKN